MKKMNNWLVKPNSKPDASLQLLCFPYAGGSISTYLQWDSDLPDNVEVNIVQLPGRGSRFNEQPINDMHTLTDALYANLSAIFNKPYIVFGHSLGSRVAFEFIQRCKQDNKPLPLHFIASGSRPPDTDRELPITFDLPEKDFIEHLEKLNGTPKEILSNPDIMAVLLPALRADFKIAETYRHTCDIKFDIPLTVIGGKDDIDINIDHLNSWKRFFNKNVHIYEVQGDHFFVDTNKVNVLEIVGKIIAKEGKHY